MFNAQCWFNKKIYFIVLTIVLLTMGKVKNNLIREGVKVDFFYREEGGVRGNCHTFNFMLRMA